MRLMEFLTKINPLITSGSRFLWNCFGANAWSLTLGEKANIVYDTKTNEIYEITFHQYESDEDEMLDDTWIIYTWYHPDYADEYLMEKEKHSYKTDEWTDEFISFDEILEKIKEYLKDE